LTRSLPLALDADDLSRFLAGALARSRGGSLFIKLASTMAQMSSGMSNVESERGLGWGAPPPAHEVDGKGRFKSSTDSAWFDCVRRSPSGLLICLPSSPPPSPPTPPPPITPPSSPPTPKSRPSTRLSRLSRLSSSRSHTESSMVSTASITESRLNRVASSKRNESSRSTKVGTAGGASGGDPLGSHNGDGFIRDERRLSAGGPSNDERRSRENRRDLMAEELLTL